MFVMKPFQNFLISQTRTIFGLWKKNDFGNCELVKLGNVSIEEKPIPDHIQKPPYYYELLPPGDTQGVSEIKNEKQINNMRKSCKLAANILKSCVDIIKVGITTEQIDEYVHNEIISHGAYPSPLRYAGFPKSVCTSVNNVACHGIPDDRPLADGDIINVDITVYYNGYHGDCSKTFLVGDVDERGKYLVQCTEECLNKSIELCHPGQSFNAIGKFIEAYVREKKLNSVYAFIGHGIGDYFHGPPEILHFHNDIEGTMEPGITFTIEPILTLGDPLVEIQEDGWTAMTVDGARTAQFEHTVLITPNGVEILTTPD